MTGKAASAGAVIRAASPGDLDELSRLCRAHADYERAGPLDEGLSMRLERAFFAREPRAFCLVLEAAGVLAGYASWSIEFSTWRGADFIHVDCLFVHAEQRGRGLGRALMDAISVEAPRIGATHLEWQTPAWNADAVRFYERLGARGTAKVRFAWHPGGGGRTEP